MATIGLIISGGIAAYKSLELIRQVRAAGHSVLPILTRGGAQFVTPLSVAALAEHKVYEDIFSLTDEAEMGHIRLARMPDVLAVVPASADILAKMAAGMADDLATTILLATDKPVLVAPAMNPFMWAHAATQANIATLRARGVHIIAPEAGVMACGEEGVGRLASLDTIRQAITNLLPCHRPLAGLHALVTTGATHEAIDPVRFLGNHASGQQGFAIAAHLARAGARVTVIAGVCSIAPPAGMTTIHVTSAQEMLAASLHALPADIIVAAAAVSDWKPAAFTAHKLKKGQGAPTLTLTENPDILAALAQQTPRARLVIGFALETELDTKAAHAKRVRKGADWLVVNQITADNPAMGASENKVTLLRAKSIDDWPKLPKTEIAQRLVAAIIEEIAT